jgi:hypothetical protein
MFRGTHTPAPPQEKKALDATTVVGTETTVYVNNLHSLQEQKNNI